MTIKGFPRAQSRAATRPAETVQAYGIAGKGSWLASWQGVQELLVYSIGEIPLNPQLLGSQWYHSDDFSSKVEGAG
jgi:hypothetical protein